MTGSSPRSSGFLPARSSRDAVGKIHELRICTSEGWTHSGSCLKGLGLSWTIGFLQNIIKTQDSQSCGFLVNRSTPNLPTKIIPTKIRWVNIYGKFPMDMRIPPLEIQVMLEPNPLRSRVLVRRLAVTRNAPHTTIVMRTFRGPLFRGPLIISSCILI